MGKIYKLGSHGPPTLILYSDASKMGWGTFNEIDNVRTGGMWSVSEQSAYINILELKACLLGLKLVSKHTSHTHTHTHTHTHMHSHING